MKVLQINAVYGSVSTGRIIKELHEGLTKRGIESYVACQNFTEKSTNSYTIGNVIDWKFHAIFSRIVGMQGWGSLISTRKLLQYVDKLGPDIVVLHNLHNNYINLPRLLGFLSNKKISVVVILHDSWFYTGKCMYYIQYGCKKWMSRCGNCPNLHEGNKSLLFDRSTKVLMEKERLFRAFDRLGVVGVSKWVTEDSKKSILKKAFKIQCIYNWIDLDLFKYQETAQLRFKLKLLDKFVILGVATSWTQVKGIDIICKLTQMIPVDCQIVLIGDYSQVEFRSDNLSFIGKIYDDSLLAKYYSMADVFLNPTIQETFGLTTAEALSCGTPVVAYNGTATPELLGYDEKCGYLVSDNRPECYLEKILLIKENTKKFYSQKARERAELLFSKEKNIEKYVELFKMLLQKK